METARGFWSDRFASAGHTGWNDPSIYAYDQLERLGLVAAEVDRLGLSGRRALDFGCGSGDFSRLLLERGLSVSAHDPFVRPPIEHERFEVLDSQEAVRDCKHSFDLILSVTVLDHVLDPEELKQILDVMRAVIAERGRLLMIEYALDHDRGAASAYQAFRSLEQWREILDRSGFRIAEIRTVPHPEEAPSEGYERYGQRLPVRVARRLRGRVAPLQMLLRPLLARVARREFDRAGPGRVQRSPLKLLVCDPS